MKNLCRRGIGWESAGQRFQTVSGFQPAGWRNDSIHARIHDPWTGSLISLLNPGIPETNAFPDNRSVLILARNAQGPGLGFYRLALGKAELLLHLNRGVGSYDLSPDGKTILYSFQSSGLPGATGFYTGRLMRFDIGSDREVELKKNEWFINVAVSPDGAELAYLKSLRDDALRDAGEYPSAVEVMPAAGGPSREVFRNAIWLTGVRYGNPYFCFNIWCQFRTTVTE